MADFRFVLCWLCSARCFLKIHIWEHKQIRCEAWSSIRFYDVCEAYYPWAVVHNKYSSIQNVHRQTRCMQKITMLFALYSGGSKGGARAALGPADWPMKCPVWQFVTMIQLERISWNQLSCSCSQRTLSRRSTNQKNEVGSVYTLKPILLGFSIIF